MATIMLSHEICKEGMDFLKDNNVEVICHNTSDIRAHIDDFKRCDGYLLRMGSIDRELILSAPNLKAVGRPGVGYDTIDVKSATEQGIPVVVAPNCNSVSVAEHTISLLFALAKNTLESINEASKGNYSIRNKGTAFEIAGKTIGIVGFGNIGRNVGRIAKGIGLNVLAFDPYMSAESIRQEGVEPVSNLFELYGRSDIVTLHVPMTPENLHMINSETLKYFKNGAILINCARGSLVDEEALYEALISGKLAGAGEDMMEKEPFDISSKLFSLSNFLATPHMAALTRESAAKSAIKALSGMLEIINGRKCTHICNPDVYKHPKWQEVK